MCIRDSASTERPESSAKAGMPPVFEDCQAFNSAFPEKVRAVSSGSFRPKEGADNVLIPKGFSKDEISNIFPELWLAIINVEVLNFRYGGNYQIPKAVFWISINDEIPPLANPKRLLN